MPPSNIATAADYADAMMIARRAKNVLFFLLLVMLLIQIAVFYVARMTDVMIPADSAAASANVSGIAAPAAGAAATRPAATQPATLRDRFLAPRVLRYVTALIDFLGMICIVMLAVVLLLITKIMLVGRLIGVARVTSAFLWCVLLGLLLFPWQAFLQNTDFTGDFKVPGILYNWSELINPERGARFASHPFNAAVFQRWARFVGMPVVAVILLLVVQAKSSRGLRAALGESELETSGDMAIS